MIKAILIFNNHGKPRLSKFYQRYVRAGRGSAGRAGPCDGRAAELYARAPGPARPCQLRRAQGSAVGKGTVLGP